MDTFTIKAGAKAVEIVNDAEIHKFLAGADGRLRLYCLLSLNTGMTQQDMSDLKSSDVDWDGHYLRRKRTKTSKHEDSPTATYKLWPETVELLRELGDTDGDRLIRKPAGQTLVVGRSDGTRHLFSVLNKSLGLHVTPLELRKASATKLASHEVYGRFGQYFLGHAPSCITDAHRFMTENAPFSQV